MCLPGQAPLSCHHGDGAVLVTAPERASQAHDTACGQLQGATENTEVQPQRSGGFLGVRTLHGGQTRLGPVHAL